MNKVHAIIYGILLLYIIFLKECKVSKPCEPCDKTGYTVKEVRYRDTIYYKDPKTYGHKVKPEAPISITTIDSTTIRREYFTTYEDTNIRGQIYSQVDGVLVNSGFYYSFKIPKQIIIHDSVIVTKTLESPFKNKTKLMVGGRLGGSQTQFNAAIGIGLKTKKNNFYAIDYDLINKSYNFNMYIPINFKKEQ